MNATYVGMNTLILLQRCPPMQRRRNSYCSEICRSRTCGCCCRRGHGRNWSWVHEEVASVHCRMHVGIHSLGAQTKRKRKHLPDYYTASTQTVDELLVIPRAIENMCTLTPTPGSHLRDASSKCRRIDGSIASMRRCSWFPYQKFVLRDTVRCNLEEGRFGPG